MRLNVALLPDVAIALSTYVLLMIGQVTPDPRITFLGFSLNWIFLTFVFVGILFFRKYIRLEFAHLMLMLVPFVAVSPMLFFSNDIDYGLYKLLNLFVVSNLCFLSIYGFIRKNSLMLFLRLIVALSLFLLGVALVYKYINGFWDRQVNFFMNGPIVFARLMGLACISSVVLMQKERLNKIYPILFFFAIVWTQSKGPLLAIILAIWFWYYYGYGFKSAFKYGFIGFFIIVIIYLNYDFIFSQEAFVRYRLVIDILLYGADEDDSYGSIGSRGEAASITMSIIYNNPMGIGIGSWGSFANVELMYPHNLFLEVFSEMGLILGSVFLVPFLVFLFVSVSVSERIYKVFAVFLLINQMYSGDILDARFLFIFSMLAFAYRQTKRNYYADEVTTNKRYALSEKLKIEV